jgi:hypothetical protein
LNDDAEAQQRIITHLLVPYAKGDFHQEYLHEHAGGRLSAFLKKDLIKILHIKNSSLAHLINAFIKKVANTYFTETFPIFIQTTGSVDGASVCAKLVSMIHDLPLVSEDPTIICRIDFANAFQTPNRQLGTNDCILGRASCEYDGGRVKIGDNLPHLPDLKNFFPYSSSMNDVAGRNRFTDHEGSTHYIAGSRGGLQGDPLEMTRFCLPVHPIWGRVLGRHLATLGAAYADDAYLMGRIEPTLMVLADTVRSFRQDADLEVCLAKCTIYMPGIPKERAHQLITECIVMNASGTLEILRPMFVPNLDVIQVHGLCVVGTPVGASHYVREYVRNKCGTICKDVEKMRVCADPLIRYHLLKFCMNTRLSFLSRNVTPDNMATSCKDPEHIGPAHVDQKIVKRCQVLPQATPPGTCNRPC